MIQYLLKNTVEVRVDDEAAADELHKIMADKAEENNATLTSWTETLKTKKSGGEVVESWVVVKYTLIFNDPKDPDIPLKSIEYNTMNSAEVVAERAAADDGVELNW